MAYCCAITRVMNFSHRTALEGAAEGTNTLSHPTLRDTPFVVAVYQLSDELYSHLSRRMLLQ